MSRQLDKAVDFLRGATEVQPQAIIIMGSGLGSYGELIDATEVIGYGEIPGWPEATAPGHSGQLILGHREGVPVAALSGRLHCYEGFTAAETVLPLQTLLSLGAGYVFLTNASGAIRPGFQPGSLMLIEDHINMTGRNPLIGPNDPALGTRFPDMSGIYDGELNTVLQTAAEQHGFDVERGVYAWMIGPSYETPAEIRALRVLGADAVGMSTVPEAIAARHAGARIAAVSCLSNLAAGVGSQPLTEEEVLEAGQAASGHMAVLADAFLRHVLEQSDALKAK